MGHDHHFLSRLDRVDAQQTELALTLYREPDLVKIALERARLPEGGDRVAISLDDPDEGPFIVVTRRGNFVTCLGRGMSRGELPLITRAQLDGATTYFRSLVSRIDFAASYNATHNLTYEALFKRVLTGGDTLTREQFSVMLALEPLLALDFVREFALMTKRALEADVMLRQGSSRTVNHRLALIRFKSAHAAGHFALLMGAGERGWADDVFRTPDASVPAPTTVLMALGALDLWLRGLWASARLGKVLLPLYKQRFVTADTVDAILDGAMGLLALASRHAAVRTEVQKTLTAQRADDARTQLGRAAWEVWELQDVGRADLMRRARNYYMEITERLPAQHPARYAHAEEVPQGAALTALLNNPTPLFVEPNRPSGLMFELPLLFDRIEVEDFYWPEASARVLCPPLTGERAWEAFTHTRVGDEKLAPATSGPRIGRNEPCPCGSGKKFKKCCALPH